MNDLIAVSDEWIAQRIFVIRNKKVMLDRDLAELYGVETKRLKEAVRRNASRFPEDFMFEMEGREFEQWRRGNIDSPEDRKGLRHPPFCFTEQGVTMLSCVLNSERAIQVNILIIRVFVRFREFLSGNQEILLMVERIERQLSRHDADINAIMEALKMLLMPPASPRVRIGFSKEKERTSGKADTQFSR